MHLTELLDLLYTTHTSTQALKLCCQYLSAQSDSEINALLDLLKARDKENKIKHPIISGLVIRKAALKLLKWPELAVSLAFKLEGNPGAAFGRMLEPVSEGNQEFTPSSMLETLQAFQTLKTAQQVGFIVELTQRYSIKSIEWFLRLFGPGEGVALDLNLIIKSLAEIWQVNELIIVNLIKSNKPLEKDKLANIEVRPEIGKFYPYAPLEHATTNGNLDEEYICLIEPPGVLAQLHFLNNQIKMFLANGTDISGLFPELEVPLKLKGPSIFYGYIVPQKLGQETVQEWFDRRLQLPQMDMFARYEAPSAFCVFDTVILHGVDLTRTNFYNRLIKLRQIQFVEPLYKLKYDFWNPKENIPSDLDRLPRLLIRKSAMFYPHIKPQDYLRLSPYRLRATIVEVNPEFGRESDPATTVTLALQDSAGRLVRVGSATIKHLSPLVIQELNNIFEAKTTKKRANSRILVPTIVVELTCDGFNQSNRHKSKIVLHQPRIIRWLRDTPVSNIDNIDNLPIKRIGIKK